LSTSASNFSGESFKICMLLSKVTRVVPKIHQDLTNLVPTMRLRMHRKSPLADKRRARRLIRNLVRLRPFDSQAIELLGGYIPAYHNVLDDFYIHAIDFRNRAAKRLCLRRPPAPDQCARQGCEEARPSRTKQSASRQGLKCRRAVAGAEQHVHLLLLLRGHCGKTDRESSPVRVARSHEL